MLTFTRTLEAAMTSIRLPEDDPGFGYGVDQWRFAVPGPVCLNENFGAHYLNPTQAAEPICRVDPHPPVPGTIQPLMPHDWLPQVKRSIFRVVTHWTATSSYSVNVDGHYHFLIDGNGKVHQVVDMSLIGHHTGKFNKGSVGVAALCMHGNAGVKITDGKSLGMIRVYSRTTKKNYNNENELKPLTHIQWESMAQVVAEICQAYNIPVDSSVTDTLYPYTTDYGVLAHGEVDKYGGPNQGGKWDPLFTKDYCNNKYGKENLESTLSMRQVGDLFRTRVNYFLDRLPNSCPVIPACKPW